MWTLIFALLALILLIPLAFLLLGWFAVVATAMLLILLFTILYFFVVTLPLYLLFSFPSLVVIAVLVVWLVARRRR